jgi:hypothetical protein
MSGERFGRNGEIIEEAKKWLLVHSSNWQKKVIGALVFGWPKAVEVDGDCVEK